MHRQASLIKLWKATECKACRSATLQFSPEATVLLELQKVEQTHHLWSLLLMVYNTSVEMIEVNSCKQIFLTLQAQDLSVLSPGHYVSHYVFESSLNYRIQNAKFICITVCGESSCKCVHDCSNWHHARAWIVWMTFQNAGRVNEGVRSISPGQRYRHVMCQLKVDCIGFGIGLPPGREPGAPFIAQHEDGFKTKVT